MGLLNLWNKIISPRNIRVNYFESNDVRIMYRTRLDLDFEQIVDNENIDSEMKVVEDKLFNAQSFGLISLKSHPVEDKLSDEQQGIVEERIKANQSKLLNELNQNFVLKTPESIKIKSADGLEEYRATVFSLIENVNNKFASVYNVTIISKKALVTLRIYNKFSLDDKENLKVFSEVNFLLSGMAVF